VWHAIIIPNYKEPIGKLRMTLDTIADNSVAKQASLRTKTGRRADNNAALSLLDLLR
jgi:hypothetical protein